MPLQPKSIEVAIVGGGLVGALLALLLAAENRSVMLLEKKCLHDLKVENKKDTRRLGLNYGSVRLFESWGLAEVIFTKGQAITHIHVSDQNHTGSVEIDSVTESLPYLGYSLPFNVLLHDLQKRARAHPRITVLEAEVTQVQSHENAVHFTTSNGLNYQADLLLGADGAHSIVRESMGIHFSEHDYHQTALIAAVEMKKTKPGWAFERFTSEGPLALLPHDENLMTVVWVMPTSLAQMRKNLPSPLLCEDLQKIMAYYAGIFCQTQPWVAYPLKRLSSDEIYRGRVGLLGNAAHSLHPVAGQGFNLSVRDILSFVETVRRAGPQPLGEPILEEYARLSASQKDVMMGLTHGLIQVFGSTEWPFQWARNAALHGVANCGFLKTLLNDVMIGGV